MTFNWAHDSTLYTSIEHLVQTPSILLRRISTMATQADRCWHSSNRRHRIVQNRIQTAVDIDHLLTRRTLTDILIRYDARKSRQICHLHIGDRSLYVLCAPIRLVIDYSHHHYNERMRLQFSQTVGYVCWWIESYLVSVHCSIPHLLWHFDKHKNLVLTLTNNLVWTSNFGVETTKQCTTKRLMAIVLLFIGQYIKSKINLFYACFA